MALETGDIIDNKYEILGLLGEGGMGAVYEGRNTLIQRRVAIKVLHASVSAAEHIVKRFEREAQAAGRIGSDHIMEVLDLGLLPSGDHYMVLEFLDGETVADRIARKGRLTASELAPLLKQALIGLQAAHQAGIVHRDLKPDNLFILKEKAGRKDFVKIIDFGISKFAPMGGDMAMTSTGAVMGTPYYMSPEQAKGAGGVTHQSDIYSMGVIAFEALSGRVPYEGTSFNDLMFKIVLNELPNLLDINPNVDPAFSRIVERAMAKSLSARFQSATDFIQAIDDWTPSAETIVGGTPDGSGPTEPPPARASSDPQAGTDTSWTNTGTKADGEVPVLPTKKTPVALFAGLGLGVVALAAIGFAALSGGSKEELIEDEQLSAAVSDPGEKPQPEPETQADRPTAEAKPKPTEKPELTEKPEEPIKPPTPEPSPAAAQPPPVVQPAPAPRPRPVVRPAPRPVAKPKPQPAPTPRPSTRDFGY